MNWTRIIPLFLLSVFVGAFGVAILSIYLPSSTTEVTSKSMDDGAHNAAHQEESGDETNSIFDQLNGTSDTYADDFNGGWRRTAEGWEHMSHWQQPYHFREPRLHPLIFLAFQLLTILLVVLMSSPELADRVNQKLLSPFRLLGSNRRNGG